MKPLVSEYFHEQCQSVGTNNILTLYPIIDWTDENVWDYIKKHKLPINPEYKENKRIGCLVCPKANFTSNYKVLLKYPKLIDCFIKARETGKKQTWIINNDNKDYSEDKVYYICRWLNHSFMPFTKKQEEYYKQVKQRYYESKTNSTNNNRTNVADDSSNERNTQHNGRV
jgi:phosphoadenosine phosphosulfate reductase